MTRVADYLRGYIAGYWAGYDFALDEPQLVVESEDVHPHGNPYGCPCDNEAPADEAEVEGSGGTAIGGADAPTTAPGPDPSVLRSAPAGIEECRRPEGSRPSAVSSLPAIHQPAAPGEGEGETELRMKLAGELEQLHAHRGMVAGLKAMAEFLDKLGQRDASMLCLAATTNWDIDEVLS